MIDIRFLMIFDGLEKKKFVSLVYFEEKIK